MEEVRIKKETALEILRDMQKRTKDKWRYDALELAIEALEKSEEEA